MKFWRIFFALALKEWLQLMRDRLTLILLISVPIAQIILFGFAIDLTPRHWPGVWVQTKEVSDVAYDKATDNGLTQAMLKHVNADGWLDLPEKSISEQSAKQAMVRGDARFILYWPIHPSQNQLAENQLSLI